MYSKNSRYNCAQTILDHAGQLSDQVELFKGV